MTATATVLLVAGVCLALLGGVLAIGARLHKGD